LRSEPNHIAGWQLVDASVAYESSQMTNDDPAAQQLIELLAGRLTMLAILEEDGCRYQSRQSPERDLAKGAS
jgi:hypothetical protein